jgi:hypothetical protein
MTANQKRTVAIRVMAGMIVVLVLTVLVSRPFETRVSLLTTPTDGSESTPVGQSSDLTVLPLQEDCRWKAAQMLAQVGLGGTVTVDDASNSLGFEIVHTRSPGEMADEAAQLVWAVFDVVLVLQEQACTFASVDVTILSIRSNPSDSPDTNVDDQEEEPSLQIRASVSVADLLAFDAGELSEEEFIQRVTFDTSPLP